MLVTCFFVYSLFDHCHPKGAVAAMAVLRALAAFVWMVPTATAVATSYSNCQSACNLGEMLCLNKNASSSLCSAIQVPDACVIPQREREREYLFSKTD